MPGQRDRHAACVGTFLVERDLFDFLLLSLPDNDTFSHKEGPDAQPASIAEADRALERLIDAGGGADAFLEDHAVVVMSDHSQDTVRAATNLSAELSDWRVLAPVDPDPEAAQIAVCPGSRSAQVYVLDSDHRDQVARKVAEDLEDVPGVDVIARLEGSHAEVWTPRGDMRFRAGGKLADARGHRWTIEGDHRALDLFVSGGEVSTGDYPDALRRLWSALACPRSGEVIVSAEPGFDFTDWGGSDHVGGGSHGSLHRCDSEGVLLMCGMGARGRRDGAQWSIEDVAPLVLDHFGAA
jgi:hypothetical protein